MAEWDYGWVAGNFPLTQEQMENNAKLFALFMLEQNVDPRAIAAMLGNSQSESTVNPGRWENGVDGSTTGALNGYGLFQWTPWTKYSSWWGDGWKNNGAAQCKRIIYEAENGIQWFENGLAIPVYPPVSFEEFLYNPPAMYQGLEVDAGLLAEWFEAYYEHPASLADAAQRNRQGKWWYQWLADNNLLHKRMHFILKRRRHIYRRYNL